MGKRWVALVLSWALSACSQQDLAFSYVGSDEGFTQATAAATAWRDACHVDITVQRGGNGIPLEEIDAPDLGHGSVEHEDSRGAGLTVVDSADVVRIQFARSARGEEVVMHELGHALGLGHLDHGIMAHVSKRTAEDVRVTAYECSSLRR